MHLIKNSALAMAVVVGSTAAQASSLEEQASDVSQELMRKQLQLESAMQEMKGNNTQVNDEVLVGEGAEERELFSSIITPLSQGFFDRIEQVSDMSRQMLEGARQDSWASMVHFKGQVEEMDQALTQYHHQKNRQASASSQSPSFQVHSNQPPRVVYSTEGRDFSPSVETNDTDTQYVLGMLYKHGQGVPRDDAKAFEWFEKAAEGGDAQAQYNLGVMYQTGQGVPQSRIRAAESYKKASQNGHKEASDSLGALYRTLGKAAGEDCYSKELVEWTQKSARNGSAAAQYGLGVMYQSGYGVPQTPVLAYSLMSLAAAQDFHTFGDFRDSARSVLSEKEIDQAQEMTFDWWKSSPRRLAGHDSDE